MNQKNLELIRCGWVGTGKPHYEKYHDEEWGLPVHDDNKHFEMLILEGAQAGLNWETILKKREGYRKAFKNFDPIKGLLPKEITDNVYDEETDEASSGKKSKKNKW